MRDVFQVLFADVMDVKVQPALLVARGCMCALTTAGLDLLCVRVCDMRVCDAWRRARCRT